MNSGKTQKFQGCIRKVRACKSQKSQKMEKIHFLNIFSELAFLIQLGLTVRKAHFLLTVAGSFIRPSADNHDSIQRREMLQEATGLMCFSLLLFVVNES